MTVLPVRIKPFNLNKDIVNIAVFINYAYIKPKSIRRGDIVISPVKVKKREYDIRTQGACPLCVTWVAISWSAFGRR